MLTRRETLKVVALAGAGAVASLTPVSAFPSSIPAFALIDPNIPEFEKHLAAFRARSLEIVVVDNDLDLVWRKIRRLLAVDPSPVLGLTRRSVQHVVFQLASSLGAIPVPATTSPSPGFISWAIRPPVTGPKLSGHETSD